MLYAHRLCFNHGLTGVFGDNYSILYLVIALTFFRCCLNPRSFHHIHRLFYCVGKDSQILKKPHCLWFGIRSFGTSQKFINQLFGFRNVQPSLGYQLYQYGFNSGGKGTGQAMALSVIIFLILIVLTMFYFWLNKRVEDRY